MLPILSDDGALLIEPNAIEKRWNEYFATLLSNQDGHMTP